MVKINKDIAVAAAVSALFFLLLFGFAGLKTAIGAVLLFFVPFYIILDNFDLEEGEKIIFSFFIGIGVFSSFVYYLGMAFGSLKIAAGAAFALLIGIGISIKHFIRKKKEKRSRGDFFEH